MQENQNFDHGDTLNGYDMTLVEFVRPVKKGLLKTTRELWCNVIAFSTGILALLALQFQRDINAILPNFYKT